MKKLYLNYWAVYERYEGDDERISFEQDYARPILKFETSITREQIHNYMKLYNPKTKYYFNKGAEIVEVIGYDEFDKHMDILRKGNEIRQLKKEIEELR